MTRYKYVITKRGGETMEVYGDGFEISATGVLSIGQMMEIQGETVPMIVLCLNADCWVSIHKEMDGRPCYQSMGNFKIAKGFVQ
jgi:hypothetical protein